MIAVRLPKEVESRLDSIAERTGMTRSAIIRQALEVHLEEMEDVYLAEERYRTLGETISLDELISAN